MNTDYIDIELEKEAETEPVPPSVEEIETELFEEGYHKKEIEEIPLDLLTTHEATLLKAYMEDKPLTDTEKQEIQEILEQYRPAIQKIKPKETITNIKNNIELVQDEKEFLRIVDEFDTIEVIPFTCYIGQKQVHMKFDLYPLTDAESIEEITQNLSLLQDFTKEELIIYDKMEKNQPLTREEQIISKGLERKIQKVNKEYEVQTLKEYLALQLKFHEKDSSVEDMKKVFDKINRSYIYLLYQEVNKRNHLNDVNYEKVFQEFD